MAELLAIDLESHRACGVLADVSSTGIRVLKTFAVDVPAEVAGMPPLMGGWLSEVLKNAGISTRQVLFCLPREEVVVRHLELPAVDDAELPQIVRFQAATKSTVPLDQLALDFLPLPQRPGYSGREALMVTVPQERIGKLFGTAVIAGLEVVSVGVSSVATAEIVIEAEASRSRQENEISLVVSSHGERVEISLVGQGHLYFSHSTQAQGTPENVAAQVLGEVSRAVIALSKRLPNAKVAHVWLLGSGHEGAEFATAAQERFACEVTRLDPFKASGVELKGTVADASHSAFAGPIGMLLGHGHQTQSAVDFVNPRRSVVKKDYTQQKRLAVAAAVALAFLGAWGFRQWTISSLQAEVVALNADLKTAQQQNEKLKPQVEAVNRIDEWRSTHINWLEQTSQFTEKMNGTERRYLSQLQFRPGTSKTIRGTIQATGTARQRTDFESLQADLRKDEQDVFSTQINKPAKDSEYPAQFQISITMKVPAAAAPTAAPAKK